MPIERGQSSGSKQPSKVAIPRLERRIDPPPQRTSPANRPRVNRACLSCRARKVKCDGGQPTCSNCSENVAPCIYASSRRDRLKTATENNQDMMQLLRDLHDHVSDQDKTKIEQMLAGVGDSVADAAATVTRSPTKPQGVEPDAPGEANVSAEVGSNEDLSIMDEDLLRTEQSRATGYLGKNSEIQWLRRLHGRADHSTSPGSNEPVEGPYGPQGTTAEASAARVDAMKRRQEKLPTALRDTSSCSFFLDDENVHMDFIVDAFELPPFEIAEQLVKCFTDSVQNSFPLLAKAPFLDQFYGYYASVGRGQSYQLPQKWQATLNLVFAIGAVYSHLIEADWRADDRDHLLYHARAWNLGLKDPWWACHPDLSQIQIMGLLALYYLAIGHVNRAWVVIGMSLRSGYALGLHVRNEDRAASVVKKEILARIWWGLYSLERILSSMTGRPNVGLESDCSVPLPLPLPANEISESIIETRFGAHANALKAPSQQPSGASSISSSMRSTPTAGGSPLEPSNSGSYLKNSITIGMITQKTLSGLYSPTVIRTSWESVQKTMMQLSDELEEWVNTLPPGLNFLRSAYHTSYVRERNALAFYYYGTRILITRPCMCRLDRRIEHQSKGSHDFNQRVAAACVQAAKSICNLLPGDPDGDRVLLYQMGPWWTMVHTIVQAVAVFMLEMSNDVTTGSDQRDDIVTSLKTLMRWLKSMGHGNGMARRAHAILIEILQKMTFHERVDLFDLFEEEGPSRGSSSAAGAPFSQAATAHRSAPQLSPFAQAAPFNVPMTNNPAMVDRQFPYGSQNDPNFLQDLFNSTSPSATAFTNLFTTNFDETNPLPVTAGNIFMPGYMEEQDRSFEHQK